MKLAHRRAHGWAWMLMAVVLALLLLGAAWLRVTAPEASPPVRIAPP